MAECTFEVFGASGERIGQHTVPWTGETDAGLLARLYREHLHRSPCVHAVLRDGRRARAIYLAEAAIPAAAVRFDTRRGVKGAWITRALQLGQWGGGRVFLGPSVCFRQVDLRPPESWLAVPLMRFQVENGVSALPFRDRELFEVRMGGGLYFYASQGLRWGLYGAGNTPRERIQHVVQRERPDSTEAFLWTIGAVRLL